MGLTTTFTSAIQVQDAQTVRGETVTDNPRVTGNVTMTNGVAIDQADIVYRETSRSLSASSTDSFDLTGGVNDAFGNALTFVKVKGVVIRNTSTTVGDILRVGGNANAFLLFNAAADEMDIGPGGVFTRVEPSLAGLTVTATTGDILDVENTSSNSIDYDIVIWGTSS